MSDGQSETCESIAQQNACVSVRLKRDEVVCWHDGEQWQVGDVLKLPDGQPALVDGQYVLVRVYDDIYMLSTDKIPRYKKRCVVCDGEGSVYRKYQVARDVLGVERHVCPACGGSGRRRV